MTPQRAACTALPGARADVPARCRHACRAGAARAGQHRPAQHLGRVELVRATRSGRCAGVRAGAGSDVAASRRPARGTRSPPSPARRGSNAPELHIAWTEESLTWPEFLSGDIAEALAHNDDAIARFEALHDPRGLSRALRSRAHAFHLSGIDEATTTPIYERSIEVARAAGLVYSVTLSQVLFAHSLTAFEQFDVVDVDSMLSEAEAVLRRHHDHGNLAHATLEPGIHRLQPRRHRCPADRRRRDAAPEPARTDRRCGNRWRWCCSPSPPTRKAAPTSAGDGSTTPSTSPVTPTIRRSSASRSTRWRPCPLTRSPDGAARIWGAASRLTPTWPLFDRRYGEWLEAARGTLGDRFDELVAQGARLALDDAVVLADSLA